MSVYYIQFSVNLLNSQKIVKAESVFNMVRKLVRLDLKIIIFSKNGPSNILIIISDLNIFHDDDVEWRLFQCVCLPYKHLYVP